jgi:ligand-binding SRPBCC domain-containing protein
MGNYKLYRKQTLPVSITEAWEFFSSPHNLKKITPPEMGMVVRENSGNEKVFAGQIITYDVSPIAGIKLFWLTEITHVKDREYFVDEQRIGPYALWHHLHRFKEIEGGVEMEDIVHYKLPLGFLGHHCPCAFCKTKTQQHFQFPLPNTGAVF